MSKILPRPTALSAPYWEGCRAGELRLQQCDSCGEYQFYPRTLCSHCGHTELSWRVASGRARLASYTVVHRPLSDAYPAPTVIVLVDLEEGPRMMSCLADADPVSLSVGQAVEVDFAAWSDDIAMPVFKTLSEER